MSLADAAAAFEAKIRYADIRTHKFDKEQLNDLIEPLLKSMNVRGSVGPRIVILGQFFPLTDFLAAYEDSAVTLRTDLAQLIELTPPCSVGRAVAAIRAYVRDHT